MPDDFLQGDEQQKPARTKHAAIAVRDQNYNRQQELLTQLAINFVHLEDITGKTTEDFLNSQSHEDEMKQGLLNLVINDATGEKDGHQKQAFRHQRNMSFIMMSYVNDRTRLLQTLSKIQGGASLEALSEQTAQAVYDVMMGDITKPHEFKEDVEKQNILLERQNLRLQEMIDDQVEFTLENIPEGITLNDDQQSALYLMTSSSAETDELKKQRARIGKHLTLPEIYRDEAETEIQKFHEYVFSNPEILDRYLTSQEQWFSMEAQEILDFANFHVGVRAQLDGIEAPEVWQAVLDDAVGRAKTEVTEEGETKHIVLLQEEGECAYINWTCGQLMYVTNHEYDHFREQEKASRANTHKIIQDPLKMEELDAFNTGLVLSYNANTYFVKKTAPNIEGEDPLELYQMQPKERYADGVGGMWMQAVMEIPRIKNALVAPITMLGGMVNMTQEIERAIEESKGFISHEFGADAQKILRAMHKPLSSSAYDVLSWAEDIKDKIGNMHQDETKTPLTHALVLASEKLDEILEEAEKVEKIERAIESKVDRPMGPNVD